MRLAELQDRFAAFCVGRDPVAPPPLVAAGLDAERLELYRLLVLNTVTGPLEKGYPWTRKQLGPDLWREAWWGFLTSHPPQDWELNTTAADFPRWLREVFLPGHPETPPWTADLADYERHEVSTYLAPDGDWTGEPALNPTVVVRDYEHDVASWIKDTDGGLAGSPAPGTFHTVIYRDPETRRCRFLNVNALTAGVLAALEAGATAAELTEALASTAGLAPAACEAQLQALFASLRAKGVLR